MYDVVSELNASKTQVFECKQDCGRYLSYRSHMQSHSCEYCSCTCFICLSSKTSQNVTTSKSSKAKELRIYIYHIISIITTYHIYLSKISIISIYHIYVSYLSTQIIISYVSIISMHAVIIYVAT
jgi:hypothetical protein